MLHRYLQFYEMFQSQLAAATVVASPRAPSKPLASIQGAYQNPAYGTLETCAVPSAQSNASSLTDACAEVINHPVVQEILGAAPNATFIAPFQKYFSSYILFEHFDANIFNSTLIWSNYDVRQEEGLANDKEDSGHIVVWMLPRYEVEWVDTPADGTGWAFKGDFWGASGAAVTGVDDELVGATGKASAEVWFSVA